MRNIYRPTAEDRQKSHIEIPQGYTDISSDALKDCFNLKSISIPDSVTSIGEGAFGGCSNLQTISIPNSVTYIGREAFFDCISLKFVSMPIGISSIRDHTFSGCSSLQSVSIPNSVTYIGEEAFSNCRSLQSVSIPNSVTFIRKKAFNGCGSLQSVSIPESVTFIDEEVFSYCKSLESVSIPNSVTYIRKKTFRGCDSLQSVSIPDSVTFIGEEAFSNCRSLQSVSIPNSVIYIGEKAFSNCDSLQSVSIPNSVTNIGEKAFSNCRSLQSVFIPNSVTSISKEAFRGCDSLQFVSIPDSVTSISEGAFRGCSNLQSISIPDSVTGIGREAFSMCSSLQSISIPNSVTSIGVETFSHCRSLQSISIPDSVTGIGRKAFESCSNLQSISIPNSVTYIGERAFSYCNSLQSVSIPDSVTSIGEGAFGGCSTLQSISIPNSVTYIGKEAFFDCSSLKSVSLPNSVTYIRDHTFSGCSSLQSISIPNSVISIDPCAFEGCYGLKNIVLENGIKNINVNAFWDRGIEHIYFDKKNNNVILSTQKDPALEKTCWHKEFSAENYQLAMNQNYKDNFIQLSNWKEEKKIESIPPEYILKIFPNSQIQKYFINNNNQRWEKLVKTLGFDTLEGTKKNNYLTDLMKIYYAIGGFSKNQDECEKAYDYIIKHVAVSKNLDATPQEIGQEIHSRFSQLILNGEYCKEFAQFFMKYYGSDPDFMKFRLKDKDGDWMYVDNYLCQAHNNFETILKAYPNRVVDGNEECSLLTPRFVAEHSTIIEYENVEKGNEVLAETVGKFGYSQKQFDIIQKIYNKAKTIKGKYVIQANISHGTNGITFKILDKDDPLSFVIGNIANSYQDIDGAVDSCIDDNYTNPEAGCIILEESELDENGKPTDKTISLSQAYIGYDPQTKTVCFENLEVPNQGLHELHSEDKHENELSTKTLMQDEMESANAKHVMYDGYSDTEDVQYILSTYNQKTKETADHIREIANEAQKNLIDMQSNIHSPVLGDQNE